MSGPDKKFTPEDMPQQDAFRTKEVFQHPQPADTGKPLNREEKKDNEGSPSQAKEEEKTSKEEGLNEARSAGDAGAFEGFEDQQSQVK